MFLVVSCATSVTVTSPPTILPDISIARHPEPVDWSGFSVYNYPPVYDPKSTERWQVDLRSSDLTKLDLSRSTSDLFFADFDSKTQWPDADKMPTDFDWQKIMEVNKDPGLGIRALHDQGITGAGVGIAIIDQTLLVDHIEYKDRIRMYEEAGDTTTDWQKASMHGAAVASIAAGTTVGVAPDADLYFIATDFCGATSLQDLDFSCWARAVRRTMEINKDLPADHKIRVLSLSWGWRPESKGYHQITAAVNEAKAAGIFVISSSLSQTDNLSFHGLGRAPLSDPNDVWSYQPGLWWQNDFYQDGFSSPTLLVPMDSRTTASPTGTEDYVFYRQGGWSWCIPYLAGVYALAVQVKPDITPEQFWEIALDTGRTIHLGQHGKDYEFEVILDPQALIEALKSK